MRVDSWCGDAATRAELAAMLIGLGGLTSLDLSGCELRELSDDVAGALRYSTALATLELSGNELAAPSIGVLTSLELPLAELDLSWNPIGYAGARHLAQRRRFAALTSLDVTGCRLGNAGCAALAVLLRSTKDCVALEQLNVSSNAITNIGIEAIAGALREHSAAESPAPALRSLDLSANDLADEGVDALAAAIADGDARTPRALYMLFNAAVSDEALLRLAAACDGAHCVLARDRPRTVSEAEDGVCWSSPSLSPGRAPARSPTPRLSGRSVEEARAGYGDDNCEEDANVSRVLDFVDVVGVACGGADDAAALEARARADNAAAKLRRQATLREESAAAAAARLAALADEVAAYAATVVRLEERLREQSAAEEARVAAMETQHEADIEGARTAWLAEHAAALETARADLVASTGDATLEANAVAVAHLAAVSARHDATVNRLARRAADAAEVAEQSAAQRAAHSSEVDALVADREAALAECAAARASAAELRTAADADARARSVRDEKGAAKRAATRQQRQATQRKKIEALVAERDAALSGAAQCAAELEAAQHVAALEADVLAREIVLLKARLVVGAKAAADTEAQFGALRDVQAETERRFAAQLERLQALHADSKREVKEHQARADIAEQGHEEVVAEAQRRIAADGVARAAQHTAEVAAARNAERAAHAAEVEALRREKNDALAARAAAQIATRDARARELEARAAEAQLYMEAQKRAVADGEATTEHAIAHNEGQLEVACFESDRRALVAEASAVAALAEENERRHAQVRAALRKELNTCSGREAMLKQRLSQSRAKHAQLSAENMKLLVKLARGAAKIDGALAVSDDELADRLGDSGAKRSEAFVLDGAAFGTAIAPAAYCRAQDPLDALQQRLATIEQSLAAALV